MAILLNDIGHGSNTYPPSKGTGTSGGVPGIAEHTFNAAVGLEVKRLLAGKLATFEAQPPNARDVALVTRINRYNSQRRADSSAIGMSHHGNAGGSSVKGFGVFYWHTSAQGKKLAQRVLAAYKKEFPDLPIWGTGLFACVPGTWTDFYLVRETSAPFVLIEWDFFTNNEARGRMHTKDYRDRCAKVAAEVAAGWYGISLGNAKPTPVIPKPKPVVKPVAKPKEDDEEMAEKIVIANGHPDAGMATLLAEYLGCGMTFRKNAEGKQVAKTVYLVGGREKGIKADKIVDLSGKNRWETAKNVTALFK